MGWLAAWLHALGALVHGSAATVCPPLPPSAPGVAQLVQRAEVATGGYAVALRATCVAGRRELEVTTVAPDRLATARLASNDGTLLDLRWQGRWVRWLHDGEMRVAHRRERPPVNLVQALHRVAPYGIVMAARLGHQGVRADWLITIDHAGTRRAWLVGARVGPERAPTRR